MRVDDHHQRSFQDDASNEGTTPQASPTSDQKGGFHLEGSPESREEGQEMTPSRRNAASQSSPLAGTQHKRPPDSSRTTERAPARGRARRGGDGHRRPRAPPTESRSWRGGRPPATADPGQGEASGGHEPTRRGRAGHWTPQAPARSPQRTREPRERRTTPQVHLPREGRSGPEEPRSGEEDTGSGVQRPEVARGGHRFARSGKRDGRRERGGRPSRLRLGCRPPPPLGVERTSAAATAIVGEVGGGGVAPRVAWRRRTWGEGGTFSTS
ncbi:hypothetical protein PVAP13_1NG020178 [Panicum virgatum]|uniref:Uncharacterized protein n=1 Tax=Panicum virgatum TaxID=38727 RepID=A0A8T0WKX1_PANVG|nr:hypothetical protein PVAP13_1NG020178 [Panicum virgatum]